MTTIIDVARLAGVSPTTVSHVINETRFVAPETRQRVVAAIESLDYEVNLVASSLASKRSRSIGIMVVDIANAYCTGLVRGAEDAANEAGYSLILCNTDEDAQKELGYLRSLRSKRVDGILISPIGSRQRYLERLALAGFPIVFFDRSLPGLRCDSLVVDNEGGACAATRHLIERGHRRIGLIAGIPGVASSDARIDGYWRALREAGVPTDTSLVRWGGFSLDGGRSATNALLDLADPPTAIFSANNLMTLAALESFRARGVEIPDDVALAAFADFEWAEVFRPSLTTVAQPTREIGRRAVELLIERIEGRAAVDIQRIVLPTRLIVRDSSGGNHSSTARVAADDQDLVGGGV